MSPPTESTKSSKFTAAKQRWLPPLRFSFSWPSAFLKLALTPANCLLIRAFAAPISPGGVSIRSQKSVFASSTVAAVATRISSTRRSNVRACAVTKEMTNCMEDYEADTEDEAVPSSWSKMQSVMRRASSSN